MFADKGKLRVLNRITHREILKQVAQRVYEVFFRSEQTLALLDAALLLENPILKTVCYPVLLVYLSDPEE